MSSLPDLFRAAHTDYEAGRLAQAEQGFLQVLSACPGHPGALYFVGAIAYQQARYAVAANYFSQAVAANPKDATFHSGLGAAYQALGRLAEALLCHQQARALDPDGSSVLNNLGITLVSLRRTDEALEVFEQARRLKPEDAEVLNNLGAALRAAGRAADAIPYYQQSLQLRPDMAQAHHNLANAWDDLGRPDETVACCRRAIEINPHFTAARRTLAVALAGQGCLGEAAACLCETLALSPDDVNLQTTYLCCLSYDPALQPDELFEQHRRWGEIHTRRAPAFRHTNTTDPSRPLRVGYLSPDFRAHAVAGFVAALLAGDQDAGIQVFCYADVVRPDSVTAGLRGRAQYWRDVSGLSDDHLIELLREDQIDILVDLAGHTSSHRLLLFARKPVPVQVSYLGYPGTTGLPTIDYRLTDAVADPPGEPRCHTEELVRLEPVFCCYAPPWESPPVAPSPVQRNGFITFGSLHKLEKLNNEVLDAWAHILKAVPTARLLVGRHVLTGQTPALLLERFVKRGVAPVQVIMRTAEPISLRHLRLYDEIDIALDAWPWNGHTTACESLWMGTPVVALRGNRHASRMTASVLSCLGLNDWIAECTDDYVTRAVAWARRVEELVRLRGELRERMRQSPLCDAPRFRGGLHQAYRWMWTQWCHGQGSRAE